MAIFDSFLDKGLSGLSDSASKIGLNPSSTSNDSWSKLSFVQKDVLGTRNLADFNVANTLDAGVAGAMSKANGLLGDAQAQGMAAFNGLGSGLTGGFGLSGAPGTGSANDAGNTNGASLYEDGGDFGYKVRLFAVRNFPEDAVIFTVSPTFSEARQVEYAQVAPVHMPGSIQVYKRTGSRTFNVGAKFVSRNTKQATTNMKYLQLLRGWTMPYFGVRDYKDPGSANPNDAAVQNGMQGNATQSDAESMLGAPPDVLYLYAYSSSVGADGDRTAGQGLVNIKKLPVVITNLSITYPDDVDYIPVEGTGEPFPVKMEVTIELVETHSPIDYEKFSLSMFKQGLLVQF